MVAPFKASLFLQQCCASNPSHKTTSQWKVTKQKSKSIAVIAILLIVQKVALEIYSLANCDNAFPVKENEKKTTASRKQVAECVEKQRKGWGEKITQTKQTALRRRTSFCSAVPKACVFVCA